MDSPEYACQLVLVIKLTAVFSASAQLTLANFCVFSGSDACAICKPHNDSKPMTLNINTAQK